MEVNDESKLENEDDLCGPKFVPQLFLQRYSFAASILNKHRIRSVVDLGCAECGICRFFRQVESLEAITLVDIDAVTLEANKFRIKPFTYEYLHKRKNPLTVRIYEGSATEIDQCIMGYEAVTMVEFIEHLTEEDLDKVTSAVFEVLNPKLVVMTTPNFEFNQLFPSYPSFRHYDHKFEWTRQEFQTWCSNICTTYNYSVEFDGVGKGPQGTENLGCCTQAAIFTNNTSSVMRTNKVQSSCYKLIEECKVPHDDTVIPQTTRLTLEIQYFLQYLMKDDELNNDDNEEVAIPLHRLLNFKQIARLCDEQSLKDHLREMKYELTVDEKSVIVKIERGGDWREDYYSDLTDDSDDSNIPQIQSVSENRYHCRQEESWD